MTQTEAVILVKDPYYSVSYFIKKKKGKLCFSGLGKGKEYPQ